MDQLTPEQPVTEVLYPTAATLGKILNAENELLLPDASVGDDEQAAAWLDLVTRTLRSDIRLRVQVDGARAPEFVEGLVGRGISSQRLDIGRPERAGCIRLQKRWLSGRSLLPPACAYFRRRGLWTSRWGRA